MRCKGCKAWEDGKCIAGITPYQSKKEIDGIGCACNTRTVEKLIRKNKKTNADRIRSMTDEELAKWLNHMQGDAYNRGMLEDRIVGYPNNYDTWLDWLRQEAEPCTK